MENDMIEHIVKKYIDDLDIDIEDLKLEQSQFTKLINIKYKERADAAKELQKVCRHINTKKDNTYTASVGNNSASTTIITCTQCHKILDTWVTPGTYA